MGACLPRRRPNRTDPKESLHQSVESRRTERQVKGTEQAATGRGGTGRSAREPDASTAVRCSSSPSYQRRALRHELAREHWFRTKGSPRRATIQRDADQNGRACTFQRRGSVTDRASAVQSDRSSRRMVRRMARIVAPGARPARAAFAPTGRAASLKAHWEVPACDGYQLGYRSTSKMIPAVIWSVPGSPLPSKFVHSFPSSSVLL